MFIETRGKPEYASFSGPAFYTDVPSHQRGEVPGNGQSEARAAILAGRGAVGLGEGIEHAFLRLGSNPYAGVADVEAQKDCPGVFLDQRYAHEYLAILGKL